MENKELFEKLYAQNVSAYTEEKNGLTYLSWASAWAEFLKVCPDATYKVKMFKDKNGVEVPYCGDGTLGYMVFTEVTANGMVRECYLPVMDNVNNALKAEPYTITNKYGKETRVDSADMFDVNKAIMRCLAKNLSMFGLGLYIYKGEDLPEEVKKPISEAQKAKIAELGVDIPNMLKYLKATTIDDVSESDAAKVIAAKEKALAKNGQQV